MMTSKETKRKQKEAREKSGNDSLQDLIDKGIMTQEEVDELMFGK
jgi:hypothetical protein